MSYSDWKIKSKPRRKAIKNNGNKSNRQSYSAPFNHKSEKRNWQLGVFWN